jgi:titin
MTKASWRRWTARLLTLTRTTPPPGFPPGRVRPQVEILEGRLLLNTYLVTNTNDSGAGSLRQAILDANANPGRDTIAFNIGGGGVRSIALASPLPTITDPVVLDATSQPGFAGNPMIELNGAAAGTAAEGLWLTAGNSVIRGLVINRFGDRGILVQNGGGNVIAGNYIGTDLSGRTALPNGSGIDIITSNNNIVGGTTGGDRNLVSGNRGAGVSLYTGSSHNLVEGNSIGTDVSATFSVGNGYGVGVYGTGTSANTIGGTGAGAGNLISGNGSNGLGDGISIFQNATATLVQGNRIGIDASGTHALGNAGSGVGISSSGNVIGGSQSSSNVVSGNHSYGVALLSGATGNVIASNAIGTDVTIRSAVPNGFAGVGVTGGANGNVIGGTSPGTGNFISGNNTYGVVLFGAGTTHNQVQGNFIGVDNTGQTALGNTGYGIGITAGASGNTIGGVPSATINVIAGNTLGGVVVFSAGTNNNLVQANHIGTDGAGTVALGNGTGSGIAVLQGAANTIIGGPGAFNQIAANQGDGILVSGPSTTGTIIQGNFIGLDGTGTHPLGNGFHGVEVQSQATNTTIGGAAPGDFNLISGNGGAGVLIDQNVPAGTLVQGNYIGTDVSTTHAVPNGQGGVTVAQGSTGAVVDSNVISGNQFYGVFLSDSSSDVVQNNFIGTDNSGTTAVPNNQGGIILTNDSSITITGNVVSGNNTDGITLNPGQNVVIQSNLIGTDVSGTSALGNGGNGIWVIGSGAVNVQIGTEDPQTANTIAFNGGAGVLVQDAQAVAILGNSIHDNSNLGIELVGQGNNGEASPQLTAATSDGTSTTIQGTLTSTPDTTFTIEFFSDSNLANPQGAQFLGSMTVTTDDSGNATIAVTLNVGLDSGQAVTATATDDNNNTSAFSQAVFVNAGGPAAQHHRDWFFAGISRKVLLGWGSDSV